jgi:hypothetical protein
MWKCRICGSEYSKMENVMKCEKDCFPKYRKERDKKYNEELQEDMQTLNNARNEYIKVRSKLTNKYPDETQKFKELYSVSDISTVTVNGADNMEELIKKMMTIPIRLF